MPPSGKPDPVIYSSGAPLWLGVLAGVAIAVVIGALVALVAAVPLAIQ